jgi:hypothetical protein
MLMLMLMLMHAPRYGLGSLRASALSRTIHPHQSIDVNIQQKHRDADAPQRYCHLQDT